MNGDFFRDSDGRPRAVFKAGYEPLAGLLADLRNAGDESTERALLRAIDEIEAGRTTHWSWSGNDHVVELSSGSALISCEFSVPPGELLISLSELRLALLRWRAFVAGGITGT